MLPSGKLVLSVGGDGLYRVQRRWADRKRWSAQGRPGDVLATIELLAREKEQQRRAEDARAREPSNRTSPRARAAPEKGPAPDNIRRSRRTGALGTSPDQTKSCNTQRQSPPTENSRK